VSNPIHQRFHGKGKGDKGEKKYLATPILPKNREQIEAAGADYNSQLKEVLRQGDVEQFRAFLQKDKRALPEEMLADKLKLETMMHQLIVSMPDLADLHSTSRDWLDSNTITLDGRTLLQAAGISPEQKLEEYRASRPEASDEKKKRQIVFLNLPTKPDPLDRHSDN
jgi:hypothetical protein